MRPKLSIITATYNCNDTISDCLSSLRSQQDVDFEHVVIDGQSVDGTQETLISYSDQISILLCESDDGLYDALNKGIDLSKGEVLGFLHADDVYSNSKVLSVISEMFDDPNVMAVYGDLLYVKKSDISCITRRWVSSKFTPSKLFDGWMPPHPALFLRRSLYDKYGLFDKRYRISADYDFILRVFSQLNTEQVRYLPMVLVKMRTGGLSNRSMTNLLRKSWEDYQIIRKHRVGSVGMLLRKNLSKLSQFF